MKKLNFGCGSIQPQDWDNIDKDWRFFDGKSENFFAGTIDFSENSYDIIVAHCSLQMIEYHDLVNQLRELRRILAPGGVLRISLPDLITGFEAYQAKNIAWFPNREDDLDNRFSAWLTWYSTSKTLLTSKALENKLFEAGFVGVLYSKWMFTNFPTYAPDINSLDTRKDECYFMEAQK